MKPWLRLSLILLMAMLISSVISHTTIRWLGIKSSHGGYRHYGLPEQKAMTILHGSSIAWDGIDWEQVSEKQGDPIESWITPGSSPVEWEIEHAFSPQVNRTFIVVSPYDLNEYWLCDFRADIVPLKQSINNLQYCDIDRQLCKKILSQYAQSFVRKFFPTSGRSDGVMVGFRTKLQELFNGVTSTEIIDAPKLGFTRTSEVDEKLSDWPSSRLQRRLALMNTAFQGKHWFNGTKKVAFLNLLERSIDQGQVVLIVMPVSPIYQKEFLQKKIMQEFENTLAEVQQSVPKIKLVRLDHTIALENNEMFSDLVHLNVSGQRIATTILLDQLKNSPSRP